jgi:hypothetical protein
MPHRKTEDAILSTALRQQFGIPHPLNKFAMNGEVKDGPYADAIIGFMHDLSEPDPMLYQAALWFSFESESAYRRACSGADMNNAGIYKFAPLDSVTEELFHSQFNLNVLGLLLTTKEAVKLIGPEGSSVINISSGVSTILPPNTSVYAASKASVDAITGILAKELGPRKIRVNSINPGMIETEGVHTAGFNEGDFRKWVEAQSPLGRIGQSDDIAPTAVYLASSDSKYLTGETIRVTGGIL